MSWLRDLKREFQNLGKPVHPRAERRAASGLAARFGLDSASTPAGIKDISATGIYLFTEKRLPTGELITLILEEGRQAGAQFRAPVFRSRSCHPAGRGRRRAIVCSASGPGYRPLGSARTEHRRSHQ